MSRTLSKREQTLAVIVGLIIVLGGTAMFVQSYLGKRTALVAKIAADKRQLKSLRETLAEGPYWEKREQWIKANQPKLANADQAPTQLLEYVETLAKKHSIVFANSPTLHAPETRPAYISVALDVETKSAWSPLIDFLEDLQSPEQFVALEMADLKVDADDHTQVRCRFKIARWFAPN